MMRIAIVNDVMVVVEALKRIIEAVDEYEVAWVAYDGAEAVRLCAEDTPDVILMDLVMPIMDGIEATRQIMQRSPCAILIVTASIGSNASEVFEAMGYGALDAVKTPALGGSSRQWSVDALLTKIDIIAKLVGKEPRKLPPKIRKAKVGEIQPPVRSLVVVGASTGGPKALVALLAALPENLPAAIVIVQHVDAQFAGGLATWLAGYCKIDVQVAMPGMHLAEGTAFVASTDDHLIMKSDFTLDYTVKPKDAPYRPSVDVFFQSVARYWPQDIAKKSAAILLTGMGHDGALGMKALWEQGWYTIIEDASSCVVYGMPKAALKMGVVKESLNINDMGPALMAFLEQKNRI